MKSKIKISCNHNGCRKSFDTLQKINQHIVKTHLTSKVTKAEALKILGIKSLKLSIHA